MISLIKLKQFIFCSFFYTFKLSFKSYQIKTIIGPFIAVFFYYQKSYKFIVHCYSETKNIHQFHQILLLQFTCFIIRVKDMLLNHLNKHEQLHPILD